MRPSSDLPSLRLQRDQLKTQLTQIGDMRPGSLVPRGIANVERNDSLVSQGLCTSPGVVEAGCTVGIATRLKRAGMHWNGVGSNVIIALRCAKLSGRFQYHWERRLDRIAA